MRRGLWLWVPLVFGCAPGDEVQLEEQDLEVSWRGSFESTDGCTNGEVELDVQPEGDGWYAGEYWFRATEDLFGEGEVEATYEVEGQLRDGRVHLEQVGQVEAARLRNAQWCFGELELALHPQFGDLLEGWWEARDCDCSGAMSLEP